ARFDALAAEWWKPNGAFKLVHDFNRARVTHIAARLAARFPGRGTFDQPLAGIKIIDVGCGAGLVAEPLAYQGAEVLGIDASAGNIAVARHHADMVRAPVSYRHALPEECGDVSSTFDVVMSLEVVEHVANLPFFLESLVRLAAPGGII